MNESSKKNYFRISGNLQSKSVRGSWLEKRNALFNVLPNTEKVRFVEFGSLNNLFYELSELDIKNTNIIFFLDDPDLVNNKLIQYWENNNTIVYFGGKKALFSNKLKKTQIRYCCFSSLLYQKQFVDNNHKAYYYGKLDNFRELQLNEIKQFLLFDDSKISIDFVDKQLPSQTERADWLNSNYSYAIGLHDKKHQNSQFYTGRIFNAIRYGIKPIISNLSWCSFLNGYTETELVNYLDNLKQEFVKSINNDVKGFEQ